MRRLMLFILNVIEVDRALLSISAYPEETGMRNLNLCGRQNQTAISQYRKAYTIWELGENKFT
jgi:hypothetical protein